MDSTPGFKVLSQLAEPTEVLDVTADASGGDTRRLTSATAVGMIDKQRGRLVSLVGPTVRSL